jgi:uncharacterized membrane protein
MTTPKATMLRSYSYGWQQFTKYFLHLFLVGLIYGVATMPSNFGFWDENTTFGSVLLNAFTAAYSLLVLPVITYGSAIVILRYMRDERADIREVFSGFQNNYLNIVLANLLVFAIVGIGLVLLIVPGIVFGCRLSFVPYLVMDRGLDPVAAIEKSWNMTRGHGWRIFGGFLLAILLFCVGFVLLIIPAFFALLWVSCAFASLYHAVDLEEKAALNANGNGNGEAPAPA